MAKYRVEWEAEVQNDFIDFWIASSSERRNRLTRASNTIDRELAKAPQDLGQEVTDELGVRTWDLPGIAPRITVMFEVFVDDRIFRVLGITVAAD